MTAQQCKRARRKFLNDPRYQGQRHKDAIARARRLAKLKEKEKIIQIRKGLKNKNKGG